jgi:hypothetical protein
MQRISKYCVLLALCDHSSLTAHCSEILYVCVNINQPLTSAYITRIDVLYNIRTNGLLHSSEHYYWKSLQWELLVQIIQKRWIGICTAQRSIDLWCGWCSRRPSPSTKQVAWSPLRLWMTVETGMSYRIRRIK